MRRPCQCPDIRPQLQTILKNQQEMLVILKAITLADPRLAAEINKLRRKAAALKRSLEAQG